MACCVTSKFLKIVRSPDVFGAPVLENLQVLYQKELLFFDNRFQEHSTHLDNITELRTVVTVYRHWTHNQCIEGNHGAAHSCMQSGIESQPVLLAGYSA